MRCKICGFESSKLHWHIKNSHHMTTKEYYDRYVLESGVLPVCEVCGKFLEFVSLTVGYYKTCGIGDGCRYKTDGVRERFVSAVIAANKSDEKKYDNRFNIMYALAASDKKSLSEDLDAVVYIIEFNNIPQIKFGYTLWIDHRLYRLKLGGLDVKRVHQRALKCHEAIDLELALKLSFKGSNIPLDKIKFSDPQLSHTEYFDAGVLNDAIKFLNS